MQLSSSHVSSTVNPAEAAKGRAAVTFVLSVAWLVALLTVSVALAHVAPGARTPMALAAVQLGLSFAGFYWIAMQRVREVRPLSALGLVRRPSQWRELGVGLAVGWGIAIVMVLPALLSGNLHTLLAFDREHAAQTAGSTLLELLLGVQGPLAFSGLPFRSLVRATSTWLATLSVSVISGALVLFTPGHDVGMAVFAAVASLLFSAAALRTRAIWVPMGLMAGWGVALNILFGVGSFYWPTTSGLVTSYVTGTRALTGSAWGPEASIFALLIAAVALVAIFRVTRGYAWDYAHDPIVAAGYAMDVAPPKEHTRMEQEAERRPVPLVQIQAADNGAAPMQAGK